MRQIKFRAWDGKRYWYSYAYDNNLAMFFTKMQELIRTSLYRQNLLRELIFEQYTGLTDKSGKEIYEGDIIRYVIPADGLTYTEDIVYIDPIEYKDGCFTVDGYTPIYATFDYDAEVIGNIHETPELLKS